MYSSLCLLNKILFSPLCWIEQRMDGVRCVVFCSHQLSSWCGATMFLCGFYTLGPGFAPRDSLYVTLNLIVVSISLCSISFLQFNN
jgi:hypothetical protein